MSRLSRIGQLTTACIVLLVLGAAVATLAVEVHLANDTELDADRDGQLDANLPALIGHLPVLFVHGHNPGGDEATNPNYQNNWQETVNSLPSFKDALDNNVLG